jgi:hypothetical protein
VSVFLERSGYTGTDVSNVGAQSTSGRLAVIVLGSNGLARDPQRRIVIAAHATATSFDWRRTAGGSSWPSGTTGSGSADPTTS